MKKKSVMGLQQDDNDLTLIQAIEKFATDELARKYLEEIRWPGGEVVCPHCKNSDQSKIWIIEEDKKKKIRPGLRQCAECKKQFTVTVGTIFEDSHIPLRKWLIAWYLLNTSKKGISSLQIQRMLSLGSYRSALFMMHRIRHALKDTFFNEKLSGVVEVDETYVGGKQQSGKQGLSTNKTPVVSLVQRGGNKRSMVMENVTGKNLKEAVMQHVESCAVLISDEHKGYRGLHHVYDHRGVKHMAKEFARKEKDMVVHTNTVESSFSLLKRGVVGTFHHVSKKHLPLYIAEFDHRWNHRKVSDGDRTLAALQKMEGKRLTYKPLITKKKK